MSLRYGEQNRVIPRLRAAIHNHHRTVRVEGSFGNHLQEIPLGDVERARTGHKTAPGTKHLERAQIQLLVSAEGGINIRLLARKGRRIQDNRVEAPALLVRCFQEIEAIGLDPFDILHSIERLIRSIWNMGFDAVRWVWRYFLLGAVIVIPVWMIMRLVNAPRGR